MSVRAEQRNDQLQPWKSKMSYRSIYIPATLTEVFPNERIHDHLEVLQLRLGKFTCEQSLRICAHLNYYVSRNEKPLMSLTEQVPLLKWFLPDNKIKSLLQKAPIIHVRNVYTAEPTIFTRHQLLELIRYIIQFCPISGIDPMKNSQSKRAFLSSALLVNELLMESTYGHLKDPLERSEMQKALLEPIRQSAKLATHARDFLQQFSRGASLFLDYMPNEVTDFEGSFQQYTGLTLKEYYGSLFIVAWHYTSLSTDKNQIISKKLYSSDASICEMMSKYFSLESSTILEYKEAFVNQTDEHPSKPIRERPILRFNEETALVLDPAFHTEKAGIGPLFIVPNRRKHFLDVFGLAFENYTQDILKRFCVNSHTNLNNLKVNQILGDPARPTGELDAVILDTPSLILFEIKGKWVKDNPRIDPDYDIYLSDLREKYGGGARQLARAIDQLINNPSQTQIEGHEISESQLLFPVLITYDSSLILPGYTQYFEKEFEDEMVALGNFQQQNKMFFQSQWRIAPLAVITIDLLEHLEESVASFKLSQLLHDYTQHRNRSPYANEDTSLTEYIKWSDYSHQIKGNERMMKNALTRFKEVIKAILPAELANQMLGEEENNGQ